MDAVDYIERKYSLELGGKYPIQIRHVNRWKDLPEIFHDLGYKVGAEIGVEQGKFSETICLANPGVELWCIDPWLTYTRYADHIDQGKLNRFYEEAKQRLAPYNCNIIRKTSMEAVKLFQPGELDFVYIDGNHEFEYVVNDIIAWSKIVRTGGIVAGHDYRADKGDRIPFHVIQAVNAYTDAYKVSPWFLLKDGRSPSWFWVKE